MSDLHPYRMPMIRIILAAPVALGVWWLVLDPVFLPLLKIFAGSCLELIFRNLDLSISVQTDQSWLITTNLLLDPQPYTQTLQTTMGLTALTLGFPVLWSFCMGFHKEDLIRKVMYGTGGLFLLSSMAVVLKGIFVIYLILNADDVTHQYLANAQYIIPVDKVSDLKLQTWLVLGNVVNYTVVLVFPLCWCYLANRDAIRKLLYSTAKPNLLKNKRRSDR